ncbi:hypothetical protein D3C75_1005800 [compost metagenome]
MAFVLRHTRIELSTLAHGTYAVALAIKDIGAERYRLSLIGGIHQDRRALLGVVFQFHHRSGIRCDFLAGVIQFHTNRRPFRVDTDFIHLVRIQIRHYRVSP